MNDSLNNGKGFLKEKMGGYQVDPPASVWNAISGRVGSRKRRGLVISVVAAAASVALAITLGINYFGSDQPAGTEVAESAQQHPEATPSVQAGPASPVAGSESRLAEAESPGAEIEYHVVDQESPAGSAELLAAEKEPSVDEAEPVRIARGESLEEKVLQAMGDVAISEEIKSNKPLQASLPDGEAALDAALDLPADAPMDFDEMPARDPRWVVGAALSPLYSFRDAAPEVTSTTTGYESGMVSYSGGIHVGYRATRRLAIETGVFFNKMGLAIDAPGIQMYSNELDLAPIVQNREFSGSMDVMAASNTIGNIVTASGDVYVNNYKLNASSADNKGVESFNTQVSADQGIRQHLDYIEVPLNLRYTLVDRSIKFQLIGGVSTNILVNNYVTMEGVDGETEIGYLTNIRNVNYSGNAGVGLIYHLMDRLSLSVEPRFRYFLHSVNDATLPSTRPYTFGLYTGLNFLF